MSWAILIPIVISAIAFLYLAFFGQQSISEWRRKRQIRRRQELSQIERQRSSPKVINNLPSPDHVDFLGRQEERARILSLLKPYPESQHSVIAIDGIGGVGKSALALNIAHYYVTQASKLPATERFEAIVWTSAKEAWLTAEGARVRPWRQQTLDDIFETIAICLGRQDITRAPSDKRLELVSNALKMQRTLLILDNLETIDDEAVHAFLRELPAPTKAIVTTRFRIDVAVAITLTGMHTEDAATLLDRLLPEDLDVSIPEEQVVQLIESTGGLPLAIVWSAAQVRLGSRLEDVLENIGQAGDALTAFSFANLWTKLEKEQGCLQMLQAAAFLPNPATAGILSRAAEAPDERHGRQVLNYLDRLALVQRQRELWNVHPLVRTYTIERCAGSRDEYLDRATAHLIERLKLLIGDERHKAISVVQYSAIDPDRPNLMFIIDWCGERRRWQQVKDLVAGLGYYPVARDLWTDGVHAWEVGALAAQECGDDVLQSRFLTYLGYMAFFMGNSMKAQYYRDQATRLVPTSEPSYQLGSLLRLSAYIVRDSGEYARAIGLLEEGLENMRACENTHGICRILNDLAETLITMGSFDKAEGMAQEALSRAEASGELTERMRSIRNLATMARKLGDVERAQAYATESRAQALESGWWDDAGKATLELARVDALYGSRETTVELIEEAEGFFDRIGSIKGKAECRAFRESLPDRDGGLLGRMWRSIGGRRADRTWQS